MYPDLVCLAKGELVNVDSVVVRTYAIDHE